MTPNKKKVMLPHTMAKAGWDVVAGRDDIDAVGYDPYITMPDLQAALKDTDGIALSLTPLKAPEIAVAPRLRVAARIGVGYDAVEIPALTARGIPLMVVGTANSVSVAEHAIFMMYALAKKVMFHHAAVRDNRWQDRWKDAPADNPLIKLPNTIVSAHMAGVTMESMDRMAVTTVKNILSVLDGTPNKENAVNKEVFG